ncbi:hypothetical protein [Marinitoga aeolica]|uniref:Uncharacterized protein n=1 Tax=Marinitoga aeolica TaxID=2809031 RepID=A0ABY8PSR5_9BACT|nr:hypothetical protein [Marinitoga aeolica]WGS65657.1 hypothetical protein JRV97_03635 [Marinitoga aeolica]
MRKIIIIIVILLSTLSFSEELLNQLTYEEYSEISQILSNDILNTVKGNIVINIITEASPLRYYRDYKNEYSGLTTSLIAEKSIPLLKYSPTAFLFFTFSAFDIIKNLNSDILYSSLMIPLGIDFYFLANPISISSKNKYIDLILLKNLIEENLIKKKNLIILSKNSDINDYTINIYVHNITQNIITNNSGISFLKKYTISYVLTMEILNKNHQKIFQKSYSNHEIIKNEEKFNVLGFFSDLALFGTGLILLFNK